MRYLEDHSASSPRFVELMHTMGERSAVAVTVTKWAGGFRKNSENVVYNRVFVNRTIRVFDAEFS